MPYNVINSCLDTEKIEQHQTLADRLANALKKYQADHEVIPLQEAYSQHLLSEKILTTNKLTVNAVIRAFGTFNLLPSGTHHNYLAAIKTQSDSEAIHSDWEMVGEDLSLAAIKNMIDSREANG